jgi:hypothetical protein
VIESDILSWSEFFRGKFAYFLAQEGIFGNLFSSLPSNTQSLITEGVEFCRRHLPSYESQRAGSILARGISIDVARQRIRDSVKDHSSLSVLRVGDGEGRFVSPLGSTPAIAREAYEAARRLWFWNSPLADLQAIFDRMKAAYVDASIVGINPPYRVKFEYRNSILGYVGVVNGNIFAENSAVRNTVENWLFNSLGDAFFREVIQTAKNVTFIGPHRDADEVLSAFGATSCSLILTPSDGIVANAVSRPHYPEVFEDVLRRIEAGAFGRLVLISSGVYAKIYADAVRKAGGVALDIGSVSDRWMKLETR